MKPYGVPRTNHCCPGHDKYPVEAYRNRRSKKARARGKQIAHQRARAIAKAEHTKLKESE